MSESAREPQEIALRPDGICLDCRRLLGPGETCGGEPPHRTVRLSSHKGRELLRDEIWGRDPLPRRGLPMSERRAGSALIVVGGVVAFLPGAIGLGLLLAGVGAVIGIRSLARRRHLPVGARMPPAIPAGETFVGRIVAGAATGAAPLTGRSCVGWSVTVSADGATASEIVCRHAWSSGFVIEARTVGRLHVPPGPLLFHSGVGEVVDGEPLARHLASISTPEGWRVSRGAALLPSDRAWEDVLLPGDRVRITGRFEPRADNSAARGLPRDVTATILTSVQPTALERVDSVPEDDEG